MTGKKFIEGKKNKQKDKIGFDVISNLDDGEIGRASCRERV